LANSKSATKRVRQSRKRQERNQEQRSRLKTAIKNVENADTGEAATEAFRKASALLDRAGRKNLMHRNKADRKKAQLARLVKEKGGTL
jgi:small subunit ribosomal protein S20